MRGAVLQITPHHRLRIVKSNNPSVFSLMRKSSSLYTREPWTHSGGQNASLVKGRGANCRWQLFCADRGESRDPLAVEGLQETHGKQTIPPPQSGSPPFAQRGLGPTETDIINYTKFSILCKMSNRPEDEACRLRQVERKMAGCDEITPKILKFTN